MGNFRFTNFSFSFTDNMDTMDIVDINKVLDDLEFNEEQCAKLTKSSEPNERSSPPPTHQTTQNLNPNDHADRELAAITVASLPTPSTQLPIPNRIFKKNFVNVSNVFNSLNEYVNAGIDTVKSAEEHTATPLSCVETASGVCHDGYSSSSSVVSTTLAANYKPAGISNVTTTVNTEPNHHAYAANATTSRAIDVASRKMANCELVVQNQSNNVPNHSVNKNSDCELELDRSDGRGQTIDGKSEMQRCESESDTTDMDEEDEEEEDEDDDDEDDDDREVQDDSRNEEITEKLREMNLNNNTYGESELQIEVVDNRGQCMDAHDHDLIENGANIVNDSDIPKDAKNIQQMEFSIVNTGINNINQLPLDMADAPELDNFSRTEDMADAQHKESEYNNVSHNPSDCCVAKLTDSRPMIDDKCDQSGRMQQLCENSVATKSTEFVKPISFEQAATMDDVSDAELESYLETLEQDMDEAKQCIESKVADEIQKTHVPMESIIHETLRDDRNADSFSQASTIEFGDGNLDSEVHLSASQFSLTNLVTEPEPEPGPGPSVSGAPNDECIGTSVDDQLSTIDTMNPANIGDTANGARRPTSLNLYKVYEVAQPTTNNAGNTPMLLTTATMPSVSSDGTVETVSPFTSDATAETSSPLETSTLETSSPMPHTECSNNADGNSDGSDPAQNSPDAGAQHARLTAAVAAPTHLSISANISLDNIGKVQPYWIPDNMSLFCMICNLKFTFIKRRHHCRACGLVLCKTCCSLKAKLEYMGDAEARICIQCDLILNRADDEARLVSEKFF